MSFWGEIRRRKVFQVAAVYAVIAWLLIQVVSTIEQPLNLPDWFDTFVIVILAIGFPVALILSWAFDLTSEGIKSTDHVPDEVKSRRDTGLFGNLTQLLILIAVGFLVVDEYLLGVTSTGSRASPPTTAGLVNRFAHTITADQAVENTRWNIFTFARNGRRFAYQSDVGIYVRDLDSLETRLIPGSSDIFANPFFSPDGRFIAYSSEGGELARIAIDESTSTTIAAGLTVINSGSWADDDTIFYNLQGAVYRVAAAGGTPQLIIPQQGEDTFQDSPRLLPDGDSLLFSRRQRNESWDNAEIILRSLSTGEETLLLKGGSDATYVDTGHVIYANGNRLFGVNFDLESKTVLSSPRELVTGVTRALALSSANYGISRDGTLAYLGRLGEPMRTLVWVNRDGTEREVAMQPGNYWYAQLSPDDSMAAINGWTGSDRHVWIHEFEREVTRQLTFEFDQPAAPIWTPDGQSVAYALNGTTTQRANGSGLPEILVPRNGNDGSVPYSFSPDGSILLRGNTDPPRSTWAIFLNSDSIESSQLDLATSGSAYNAVVSPDGRWVAYQSDMTGRLEVYVRSFPDVGSGGRWQISTRGGLMPLWNRDSNNPELFFLESNTQSPGNFRVMRVTVDSSSGDAFVYGTPEPLFERRVRAPFSMFRSPYDVSRDGASFLMIKDASQQDAVTSTSVVVIVQNWLEEVNELLPPAE